MTWSPYCGSNNWYETCDVIEQGVCKRHNNWGQAVDCIVANPPFPGPGDNAEIPASGTVILPAAAANIGSLTLMGQLTMYGHTMTATSGQIINGQFTVGAVTLEGAQPLELIGGESSRFQITNVSGYAGLSLIDTEIRNDGLVTWEAGNIGMSNGSKIVNQRTFNVLSNNSVQQTGGALGSIENAMTGQMIKSSAGLTNLGVALLNDGLLRVEEGTLAFLAGGSNSGYIELGTTSTLAIQSGTFVNALPGFILGDGLVRVVTGGTFALDFPAVIERFELAGGTVDGAQAVQINDSSFWQGGTMQGAGVFRIASGASMIIPDTPQQKTLAGRPLDNQGLIQLQGIETIDMSLAATVTNSGTFQVLGDGGLTWNHGGAVPTVTNSGSFLKTGGTGTSTVDAAFTNTGLVEIVTGTASLAGTIELALIGGYDPPLGSQFDVVTAASVSGTFGVVQKTGVPPGKDLRVTYPPGKVRVTVVPPAVPMAGWELIAALSAVLAAAGAWRNLSAPGSRRSDSPALQA